MQWSTQRPIRQAFTPARTGFFIDKPQIKNYTVTLHTTLIMMMHSRF
jgi:hypothetical protein